MKNRIAQRFSSLRKAGDKALITFITAGDPDLTTTAAMLFTSLAVGYLTMDLLIRFAKKINFSGFCLVMGLMTLLLSLWL